MPMELPDPVRDFDFCGYFHDSLLQRLMGHMRIKVFEWLTLGTGWPVCIRYFMPFFRSCDQIGMRFNVPRINPEIPDKEYLLTIDAQLRLNTGSK
jgi:hypothetical protein